MDYRMYHTKSPPLFRDLPLLARKKKAKKTQEKIAKILGEKKTFRKPTLTNIDQII